MLSENLLFLSGFIVKYFKNTFHTKIFTKAVQVR